MKWINAITKNIVTQAKILTKEKLSKVTLGGGAFVTSHLKQLFYV